MLAPLMVAVPLARPAYALDDVTSALTEWTIPTPDSMPAGLALDSSGECCWFVESSGNKVAHLDPSTGTFREWAVPTSGSGPTSLALTMVSGSPVVVGTESAKNNVFVFFPNTGTFKEYTAPEDPRPQYVSIEPAEKQIRAWFTNLKGNWIGEIVYDLNSGTARLYQLTLPAGAGGGAKGVHAVPGTVWLAGVSTIVRWDIAASQFTGWAIPSHPSTQAAFIDVDELGEVWYTSSPGGTSTASYVGVLRSDNTFTEWQVPTASADVQAISINPVTQNPWIAEQAVDKIAKLDPSTGGIVTNSRPATTRSSLTLGSLFTHVAGPMLPSTVTVTPTSSTLDMSSMEPFAEWILPSGSRPQDLVVDVSGDAWILESSANKVARLSLRSDFVVECDPSSLIVVQNANATSTCTVTSIDGFASAVQLAGNWSGPQPGGVAFTLPTPVTPPPGRGVSSSLILSAGPTASTGTFTFQVTGTSGSLTHTVGLEVTVAAGVADFAITVSPSYLPLPAGATGTSTITIQSLGVFFSSVSLSSSGAPEGMILRFETNPVTPPIGGTGSSTLTVTVSGAPVGTHTVTVTGNGGSVIHSATLTVQVPGTAGPCLIATATYGSELSEEVQFLRGFRDNSILKTNTGSDFMIAFNAWYYSFSPSVAGFISDHPSLRTIVKFVLYPLIGILRVGAAVFDLFPTNLEAAAVVSGLIVSFLIGVVYLAFPLAGLVAYSSRARRIRKSLQAPAIVILFGALVTVGFAMLVGAPAIVMVISTSTLVLAALAASSLLASRMILHIVRELQHKRSPAPPPHLTS
jgi:streptogramin lyase